MSFRQRAANSVSRSSIDGSSEVIQAPFISGELLAGKWLKLLASDDIDQLKIEIARYRRWLADLEPSQFEQCASIALPNTIIIQARTGKYCLTHPHSPNSDSWSVDRVVLRGLFWFAIENRPVFNAFARQHDIHSITNFVERCLPEIALDNELKAFVVEEQKRHDLNQQAGLQTDISSEFHQIIGESSSSAKGSSSSEIDKQSNALSNALEQKDQSLALAQKEITGNLARINQLTQHREDLLTLVETVERRVKTERNVQGNLYAQIEHLQARLHARRVENEELNKFNKELHQFLLMRPTTRIKNSLRGWINRLKGQAPVVEAAEPEPVIIENENPYREIDEEPPFDQLPEGKLIGMNTEDYDQWIAENTLSKEEIEVAKADIEAMPYKPVFSILVPVYNTDPEYLSLIHI